MKLTKRQFIFAILSLAILAGIIAHILEPLIGNENDFKAENIYFVFYLLTIIVLMKAGFAGASVSTVYGGSILFCFFYIIIAPIEACIMMALFFWPALKWQKKEITLGQLAGFAFLAIFVGLYIGKPAILFLLFPTCHILAVTYMGKKVQTRYSKDIINLRRQLTRKQKEIRGWNDKNKDWWDYLQPELEALPEKISASWTDLTEMDRRTHMGDDSVLNRHLLHLQDPRIMSKSLTAIQKRDDNFDAESFLKRTDTVFWKIQKAWYGQDIPSIQSQISDALFEQLNCQIEEQKAIGVQYQYRKMRVYETRIAQISSDDNLDVIHVFIRGSSQDFLIDLETKKVLAENDDLRQFCEYWTFVRKTTAKTLLKPGLINGNCPNCGAPIEIGQTTVCKICNSFIRSGLYDWVLAKITQACEWEYSESSFIPGWRSMKMRDENFTLQQIEDRTAVIFWMQRLAERSDSINPVKRFSTLEYCENEEKHMKSKGGKLWDYLENVSLASVKLKGFKLAPDWDRVYMLVVWSGVPVLLDDKDSIQSDDQRYAALIRQVYVLIRRHGTETNVNTTLTSAHCPNCGGPLVSTYTVECTYCNTILNEGTAGWILEKIVRENDEEYLEASRPESSINAEKKEDPGYRSAIDTLAIMIQVLLADGVIDDREKKLLQSQALQSGISKNQLISIFNSIKKGNAHIPAPANSSESWDIMMSAARMALSDEQVAPEEEHCLNILAQYLGYSQADVQRALKQEAKRRHIRSVNDKSEP